MLESFFALLGLAREPVNPLPSLDLLEIHAAPQLEKFSEPVVAAKAALLVDLGSGKILWGKQIDEKLPIASLTKLMTAVVARENFGLGEIVSVSAEAAEQPPAKIWLAPGEQISVGNLLQGMLIESANDAAFALAGKVGSEDFVAKMNLKAAALGLAQAHFANPVGYDDEANFATARDLAILAQYFLRDEFLRNIVATQRAVIASTQGKVHPLVSTNQLFGSYLDVRGLKTGSTDEAGECVATIAHLTNGAEILAIVLNSPNRFQEAKALLTWAEKSFHW
ncbi:MAG: serine hydrolase [Patescibacteria group bacterium]